MSCWRNNHVQNFRKTVRNKSGCTFPRKAHGLAWQSPEKIKSAHLIPSPTCVPQFSSVTLYPSSTMYKWLRSSFLRVVRWVRHGTSTRTCSFPIRYGIHTFFIPNLMFCSQKTCIKQHGSMSCLLRHELNLQWQLKAEVKEEENANNFFP